MRPDVGEPAPTQQPGGAPMSIGIPRGAGGGRQGAPTQAAARPRPLAAANKARLAEIGLAQTVQAIASAQTEQTRARRAAKAASRAARKAAGAAPAGRVRRCAALCPCCRHSTALGSSLPQRTALAGAGRRRPQG